MQSPNREPEIGESLETIFGAMLNELHTALPAKIEKWTGGPLADVKPVLLRVFLDDDNNEIPVEYPVITDVPVCFPRGGGAFMSLPLKKGDPVLLVMMQRSLDRYLDTDGSQLVDPQDSRRHHISDAVAFAGMSTVKNKIPNASLTDLVIGLYDGSGELHLQPGGKLYFKGPSVMMGDKGLSDDDAVVRKSDLQTIVDDLNTFKGQFKTHKHIGNMGAPTPINPADAMQVQDCPAATASSILKAKE